MASKEDLRLQKLAQAHRAAGELAEITDEMAAAEARLAEAHAKSLSTAEGRLKAQKKLVAELAEELAILEKIGKEGVAIAGVDRKKLAAQREAIELMRQSGESNAKELAMMEARIDGIEAGMDASASAVKRFTGITGEANSLMGNLALNGTAFIEGMVSGSKEIINAQAAIASAVDKASELLITSTIALAKAQDTALVNFKKTTGATNEFDKGIMELERDFVKYGISADEAGQVTQALFTTVTDFTNMSGTQRKELTETVAVLNELGVSAETSSKNIQFAIKVLGKSGKQAEKLQRELFTFAQELGVSASQISDDFATMAPQIAAIGSNGVDAFKKLQVQAKSTGLALSELLDIVNKFDTFDAAAQSVGKLNALLGGPYLNTLELVAETDPSKRFELLKQGVDAAGKSFETMEYYERKALAAAIGINEQQLAMMMRGSFSLIKQPVKTAEELEKMAQRTQEFNTLAEEMTQAFMAMALAGRPFLLLLKDAAQYVQDNAMFFRVLATAVLVGGTALGIYISMQAMATAMQVKDIIAKSTSVIATLSQTKATGGLAAANWTLTSSMLPQMLIWGALAVFIGLIAYMLWTSSGSPGLITILGITALAFVGMGIAANVFGFSIAGALPFILAFAAAILMVGAGIGMASAGLAALVSSLNEFGTGLAESMLITAMAIKSIVEDINELDTVKTIALGGVMVATAVAAPAAALAAVGTAAVTRGAEAIGATGAPAAAPAAAAAMGPPPVINISLNIDGSELATVVNSVEVEKYTGGKPSKLYSTVIDMIEQGFVKGT
jgi:hypothetical protein